CVGVDSRGNDAAKAVQRDAEVDGEALVGERVHADGLMVDAAHALVQSADVHRHHAGFYGGAHAKSLQKDVAMSKRSIPRNRNIRMNVTGRDAFFSRAELLVVNRSCQGHFLIVVLSYHVASAIQSSFFAWMTIGDS